MIYSSVAVTSTLSRPSSRCVSLPIEVILLSHVVCSLYFENQSLDQCSTEERACCSKNTRYPCTRHILLLVRVDLCHSSGLKLAAVQQVQHFFQNFSQAIDTLQMEADRIDEVARILSRIHQLFRVLQFLHYLGHSAKKEHTASATAMSDHCRTRSHPKL